MNKVILMGRLTRDPDVRYSQAEPPLAVARFTLAVDRRFRRQNESGDDQNADFISCVAFGKQGEFVEKYAHKGTKFCIAGRIQTGRYTNKDGQTVYTTDVVCEEIDFAESKAAQSVNTGGADSGFKPSAPAGADDGFMNIPDEIDDDLPFN
ncbi:MAG: single-stranded DNA-binding protein [Lachnospiraceae bacterium]|nr:single-stranded DNA-binding protein [Lachnospiraceae bacterium]MBR1876922.1 single-stranded DNA-binding protein [Lachnospiraceae bacterium]